MKQMRLWAILIGFTTANLALADCKSILLDLESLEGLTLTEQVLYLYRQLSTEEQLEALIERMVEVRQAAGREILHQKLKNDFLNDAIRANYLQSKLGQRNYIIALKNALIKKCSSKEP